MVNINKSFWLLNEVESAVIKLRELAKEDRETFWHNDSHLGAAKYFLQTAIEACLQISQHIIASEDYRSPQNQLELFAILGEHGILPVAFADTMKHMAEFQQVLIHQPWEIKEGDVYNILQNHLHEFDTFNQHLRNFINPQPAAE
jgi:uncharacterized protein YutE (UPF0331/DUF86 family)